MTAKGRRALPIRLLAGLMEAYKRSADQQMRIPDHGTPGYPDWPEAPPPPEGAPRRAGRRHRGRSGKRR